MNHAPLVRIVDDDESVLQATTRLLASVGIASQASTSPTEFLAALDTRVPGCVVLDIQMPGCDGLALQEILQDMAVTLPIVFLTGYGDVTDSICAMRRGALDFLTKPIDGGALLQAVERGIVVDRDRRSREDADRELRTKLATLTRRECEIMGCLLSGKLNKQIAGDLGVVETTVKVHRARVMHKLGVQSLAELVYLAEHAGIRA